jgi:hypothetical protein
LDGRLRRKYPICCWGLQRGPRQQGLQTLAVHLLGVPHTDQQRAVGDYANFLLLFYPPKFSFQSSKAFDSRSKKFSE